MQIKVTMPKRKRPIGKLNFGGAEFVDMQDADMSLVTGIRGAWVLDLSNTIGLHGKWDFTQMGKVFLCGADLSKVYELRGGEVMSFYGTKGLRGIIDLTKTQKAYFQDVDLSGVKTILCKFQTQLIGLNNCKGYQDKVKYAVQPETTELTPDNFPVWYAGILKQNQK